MALPPGITAKTVNVGIASFFDGSLSEGTVTITCPVNVVHTPTNRPIFSSQISKRFVDGEATFDLCPTDAPGLNRIDFSYKANIVISGALVQPEPIYFLLPTAGPDTIDLDGLVTVPSSAGTPISVDVLTTEDLPGHILDVLPAQMATVAGAPDSDFAGAVRVIVDAEAEDVVPPLVATAIAANGTVAAAAATAINSAVTAGNVIPRYTDVGLVATQVLVDDTFTRANSTTTLGNAETGQAWIYTGSSGAIGIINNAAYLPVTGGGVRHSIIDTTKRDVTVALETVIPDGTSRIGIALRQLDANNALGLLFAATELIVYSINDSTHTVRATIPISAPAGAHRFSARIDGDATATTIQAYVDGVLVHTHLLSSADATKFANGTQHGIKWSVPPNAGATRVESVRISTPLLPTDKQLREWANSESYEVVTAAALDTDGFAPSAVVRWPDGAPGVYTLVTKKLDAAYKAVDAYTLTHPSAGRKVTQTAPTRAAAGNVTAKPALTVGAL